MSPPIHKGVVAAGSLALWLVTIPVALADGPGGAFVFAAGMLMLQGVLLFGLRAVGPRRAPDARPGGELERAFFATFGFAASAMVLTWFGLGTIIDGLPAVGIPVLAVALALALRGITRGSPHPSDTATGDAAGPDSAAGMRSHDHRGPLRRD
jgi:hypothetical protein